MQAEALATAQALRELRALLEGPAAAAPEPPAVGTPTAAAVSAEDPAADPVAGADAG